MDFTKRFQWAVIGLVLAGSLFLASPTGAQQLPSGLPSLGFDVSAHTIQNLFFEEDPVSGFLHTAVEVNGEIWTLELHRISMRADDFQVLVDYGTGELVPYEEEIPIITWKGTVLERSVRVRASYENEELRAVLYTDQGVWAIQPVADAGMAGITGDHIVYRASDLILPEFV